MQNVSQKHISTACRESNFQSTIIKIGLLNSHEQFFGITMPPFSDHILEWLVEMWKQVEKQNKPLMGRAKSIVFCLVLVACTQVWTKRATKLISPVCTYSCVVAGIQHYLVDFQEERAWFSMYPYISSSVLSRLACWDPFGMWLPICPFLIIIRTFIY